MENCLRSLPQALTYLLPIAQGFAGLFALDRGRCASTVFVELDLNRFSWRVAEWTTYGGGTPGGSLIHDGSAALARLNIAVDHPESIAQTGRDYLRPRDGEFNDVPF